MRERWSKDIVAVQCGELHLDLVHRRAMLGDAPMHLPPRIIDLLAFFLAAPDQLHSREAILADVWEGLVVEEGSLGQAVWLLRKALGPARRDSLQSVPKRGYVFHPWGPVSLVGRDSEAQKDLLASRGLVEMRHLGTNPARAGAPSESTTSWATATAPQSPKIVQRLGTKQWVVMALLVAIVLVGAALTSAFRLSDVGEAHRTIALLVRPTPEGAVRELQLALLLQDWLQYRLASSVQTLVLTDADLDEEEAYRPTLTLMLSVVPISSDASRSKLRVDLHGEGAAEGAARMEREIRHANLDDDLDRFVAEVLDRLRARPSDPAHPRFALGKAITPYAAALDSARRGRHQEALQQLEAALLDAPEFPPLRLRLARAQMAQGESISASEHYRTARALDPSWGQSSPYLLELERAQANTFADTRRVAERYLDLYRAHPKRLDLLLDAVEAEASPLERLRLLEQADWTHQASVVQRRAKLLECWALLTLGRPAEADACASSLVESSKAASQSSALRHVGEAKSIIAIARYNQNVESPDFSLFEDAAQAHLLAGRPFQALRIRAQAELLTKRIGHDSTPVLDDVLQVVARNRLRATELSLRRSLVVRLVQLNDYEGALAQLKQVRRTAVLYGGRREIAWAALALASEHWNRAEFEEIHKILDELEASGPDIDTLTKIVARRAAVLEAEGRFQELERILERHGQMLDEGNLQNLSAESAALFQMELVETALRAGAFDGLDAKIEQLQANAPEHLVASALLLKARLKFYLGDSVGARAALDEIRAGPLPKDYALSLVAMELDFGVKSEFESVVQTALDQSLSRGHRLDALSAQIVLAQGAAMKRDWNRVDGILDDLHRHASLPVPRVEGRARVLRLVRLAATGQLEEARKAARQIHATVIESCDVSGYAALMQVVKAAGIDLGASQTCEQWQSLPLPRFSWIDNALGAAG